MKGFIKKATAACCFGVALIALVGCARYREIVDPCWPARYNIEAAYSVRNMSNAQTDKGHVLDHTVYNSDFEDTIRRKDGTYVAALRLSGIEKLQYISHREPIPVVMKVYLENAHVPYDAKKTTREQIDEREAINQARRAAVSGFLATTASDTRTTAYEILVHDYAQPTYQSLWSIQALNVIERNIKNATPQAFIPPTNSGK